MPYDETLAERVLRIIPRAAHLHGKKMFDGICFMVSRKMAIGVTDSHSASPFASPVIPKPNPTR